MIVLSDAAMAVEFRRYPGIPFSIKKTYSVPEYLLNLLSVWSPGAMTLQCEPRWARRDSKEHGLTIADKYSLNLCMRYAICNHCIQRTIQKYSSIPLAEIMSYNTLVEIMSRFVMSIVE